MTCQCGKEITSPQLTGELCTACFFNKRNETNVISIRPEDNPPTDGINIEAGRPDTIDETSERDSTENVGGSEKDNRESEREKPTIISKDSEVRESGIKYCQSCEERGYGLVPATREWTEDYFICDACFEPLINNIINPNEEQMRVLSRDNPEVDINKPILNQFYDLLQVPEALRFNKADKVLSARNDIFNHNATAIINKDQKEILSEIEQLQIMLFQIKIAIEPRQDYINRVKHDEREKNKLTSIDKSKKEFAKSGPSKVKASQEQKMADTLFKLVEPNAEKRLKMYQDLQKQAREEEFKKRTGT